MFGPMTNWFAENPFWLLLYFGILGLSAFLWSTGRIPFEDERTED